MKIMNMEKYRDLTLQNKPYGYADIVDVFHCDASQEIFNGYPESGFSYCEATNKDKTYSMYMRQLFDNRISAALMIDDLNLCWHDFMRELLSRKYLSIMSKYAQRDLSKAYIEINCWHYLNGCWLSPHTDKPEKIISQLFYFNKCWDKSWGGGFRILNSNNNEDVYNEIFPDIGTSIILVRSDSSWHSVAPLTSPEGQKRKLLQVIFWES